MRFCLHLYQCTIALERVDRDLATWHVMNMTSKDSHYLAHEVVNDGSLEGLETISLGFLCNNNDIGHSGGNMGLDNPNGAFAFDGDDIENDDELHIWSNITDPTFLSNVNVCPAKPTSTILDVQIAFEPCMHEDVVAKPNVDEAIDKYGTKLM